MQCTSPVYAVKVGKKDNGKAAICMLGYRPADTDQYVSFGTPLKQYPISDVIKLPCGCCTACRINRSAEWANRCLMELQYHDQAWFCTFTYDDLHVPMTYYPDPETGEAIPAMTLRKRDSQLLLKRIRKEFADDQIRFFGCGEYGDKTHRPHYHIILFGLHLDDLIPYKTQKLGDTFCTYYNSPRLQRCWKNGYVVVGNVTWESCAYTARYVMKKQYGKAAEFYELHNIEPEFNHMSRKPGLGYQYFLDHPDCFKYEEINVSTPTGGKNFRPPKYFEKKYQEEKPDEYAKMKQRRLQQALKRQADMLSQTSLTSEELDEMSARRADNIKRKLKRSDC